MWAVMRIMVRIAGSSISIRTMRLRMRIRISGPGYAFVNRKMFLYKLTSPLGEIHNITVSKWLVEKSKIMRLKKQI